jgi:hypothetical protein
VEGQRQELNEAMQYTAWVRQILDSAKAHLTKSAFDQALEVVQQSSLKAPGGDPVLQVVVQFVNRLRKEDRPWKAGHAEVLEQMAQQSAVWKKARLGHTTAGYVAFLNRHPNSPFSAEAQARLVDLEVAGIFKGEHGQLPPADRIRGATGRTYSIINIHNDTEYKLTLRYSGPGSFSVVFAPNEKGSVEALVGSYKVAASVNASNVRDYAGEETLTGDDYQVTFYIQHRNFLEMPRIPSFDTLRIPRTPVGGKPQPFQPWSSKRKVPAYLK